MKMYIPLIIHSSCFSFAQANLMGNGSKNLITPRVLYVTPKWPPLAERQFVNSSTLQASFSAMLKMFKYISEMFPSYLQESPLSLVILVTFKVCLFVFCLFYKIMLIISYWKIPVIEMNIKIISICVYNEPVRSCMSQTERKCEIPNDK